MSSTKPFVASAPGKVILFGEHAVVYGKTAIAASLNLRTQVFFESNDTEHIKILFPDINVNGDWSLKELLKFSDVWSSSCIFKKLQIIIKKERFTAEDVAELDLDVSWAETQVESLIEPGLVHPRRGAIVSFLVLFYILLSGSPLVKGFGMRVVSQLPVGAGLGSSASFSVSLSGCLLNLVRPDVIGTESGLLLINRLGYLAEKIIHGNPSGVDNTVSTYGQFVKYCGGDFERVERLNALQIILTNTLVPRNTKHQVAMVGELRSRFPSIIDPVLEAINGISSELLLCLQKYDTQEELESKIMGLIELNHALLRTLGTSHPTLDKIVTLCNSEFGMSAKLTGAGGGGCALTFVPESKKESIEKLCDSIHKEGFVTYSTILGGPGFRIDKITDFDEISRIINES